MYHPAVTIRHNKAYQPHIAAFKTSASTKLAVVNYDDIFNITMMQGYRSDHFGSSSSGTRPSRLHQQDEDQDPRPKGDYRHSHHSSNPLTRYDLWNERRMLDHIIVQCNSAEALGGHDGLRKICKALARTISTTMCSRRQNITGRDV